MTQSKDLERFDVELTDCGEDGNWDRDVNSHGDLCLFSEAERIIHSLEERLDLADDVIELYHKEAIDKRDIIRGFMWLFEQGVFIRNTKDDSLEDYFLRSLKLTQWLAEAYTLARVEESDAP